MTEITWKGLRTFSIMHTKLIADPISTWSSPEPKMKASGTTTWRFTKCDITPVDVDTWKMKIYLVRKCGKNPKLLSAKLLINERLIWNFFASTLGVSIESSSFDWSETISAQNTTLIDVVCQVKKLLKTFTPLIFIVNKIASVCWRLETKKKFTTLHNFTPISGRKFSHYNEKRTAQSDWEKKFCNNVYRNIYFAPLNSHKKAFTVFFPFVLDFFGNERWSNQI